MSSQNPFLFTYGTLKKSFENPFSQKLREKSEFVSEGYFSGKMYRISWYPGAVADTASDAKVYGEIFRILDASIIAELDDYEDVLEDENASLYLRKIVPVTTPEMGVVSCWTYLYNQPVAELELIPDGIFTG